MAKTENKNEFVDMFKKLFADSPVNLKGVKGVLGNVAGYNSKFSEIAMDTAKKNTALAQAWANDTLGGLESLTKVQKEPAGFAKVATDFVSAQTKSAPAQVAAFAEVVKQAQIATVELLVSAGKELQAGATKVAGKATPSKA